jgi:hypothetical protein
MGPSRGVTREEAKPYPCFKYAEANNSRQLVSTCVSGALTLAF